MKSNYDFSNAVKILVNEGLRGLEVVMDYLDAHFKSLSDTSVLLHHQIAIMYNFVLTA